MLLASAAAFGAVVVITTVFVADVAAEVEVDKEEEDEAEDANDRAKEVGRERIGGGGGWELNC